MQILFVLIASLSGLIVLLGYFIPTLIPMRDLLVRWAIIFAGAAIIPGIFNLLSVHWGKIRQREKGQIYSALLIVSLSATFLFTLALGPQHDSMQFLLDGLILPAEAALMSLLAVSLVYAAVRLLRRRVDFMSVVFLITVVTVLLGSATLPFGDIPLLGTLIQPWITQVLALGGARGILIGVALGTLTTGLRILLGSDRPYGGG